MVEKCGLPKIRPEDLSVMPSRVTGMTSDIRPFNVDIPQPALDDLNRRLDATRWAFAPKFEACSMSHKSEIRKGYRRRNERK